MSGTSCVHHEDQAGDNTCRICGEAHCNACFHHGSGICHSCIYKGLILVLVIMVILSYVAWYAIL
ncbi:MAG: hypothetical protein LUQ07_05255 [Methanospirillum sp.]|nr:hypothetical protein [Methanospirillum sp.]